MRERTAALGIGLLAIGTLVVPVACLKTECDDPGTSCGPARASGGGASTESGGAAGASDDAGAPAGGAAEGGATQDDVGAAGEGGATTVASPRCGDGWVDVDETCDDGMRVPGDGCDADCQLESGWVCGGDPSQCVDIDECATNNGNCDALTTCTNALGTYSCSACPAGYLGDGETGCAAATVLATSNIFACGIKTDGSLLCWGTSPAEPPPGTFTSVSLGIAHGCAIRTDGTVACWGDDGAGQSTPPSGTFKAIAAGGRYSLSSFTCGIRTEGDIRCWGAFEDRILGTFRALDAGELHFCAINTGGHVICSGNGDYGGTFVPYELDNKNMVSLGLGSDYSCALDDTHATACWGSHVPAFPQGALKALAASEIQICGIRTDETVGCWGDDFGQGPPPSGTFKAIALGPLHGCGLHADGKAECWGGANIGPTPPDTFLVW